MRPQPAEFDLPGVTPSRQQRSRETTAALLQAGAELLRTRSFGELSIEALCAKVGATVGAFYSRFESKEAYFNALMALAARDGERRLADFRDVESLNYYYDATGRLGMEPAVVLDTLLRTRAATTPEPRCSGPERNRSRIHRRRPVDRGESEPRVAQRRQPESRPALDIQLLPVADRLVHPN